MSISELTFKSKDEPVRRFEVFTGNGRRRDWSDDQKAQIIAESCEPGVTVCSVARRHGLTPQQLFTWRRLARKPAEVLSVPGEEPMFAPAVVVSPEKSEPKKARQARLPRRTSPEAAIELQIDGATLRIASGMRMMGERFLTDGMLPEGGDLERLTMLLGRPLRSYRDFASETAAAA